jgi:hypothetical protein
MDFWPSAPRGGMMAANGRHHVLRLGLVLVLVIGAAGSTARAGLIPTISLRDARLCADPACETMTMELVETFGPLPVALMGTLQLDLAELRIEFDLALESALLQGSDGIWTGLELRDFHFRGGGDLTLAIRDGKTGWAITDGSAQVDGNVFGMSPIADGAVIPFSATPALSGTCRQVTSVDCFIFFGPGEFAIPFDGGRYLEVSLTARVPEPETLVLVVLGVAAISSMRRQV